MIGEKNEGISVNVRIWGFWGYHVFMFALLSKYHSYVHFLSFVTRLKANMNYDIHQSTSKTHIYYESLFRYLHKMKYVCKVIIDEIELLKLPISSMYATRNWATVRVLIFKATKRNHIALWLTRRCGLHDGPSQNLCRGDEVPSLSPLIVIRDPTALGPQLAYRLCEAQPVLVDVA